MKTNTDAPYQIGDIVESTENETGAPAYNRPWGFPGIISEVFKGWYRVLLLQDRDRDQPPYYEYTHNELRRASLLPDEEALVQGRQAIGAIKEVRQRLHIGLKEAKDMVEAYMAKVEMLPWQVTAREARAERDKQWARARAEGFRACVEAAADVVAEAARDAVNRSADASEAYDTDTKHVEDETASRLREVEEKIRKLKECL